MLLVRFAQYSLFLNFWNRNISFDGIWFFAIRHAILLHTHTDQQPIITWMLLQYRISCEALSGVTISVMRTMLDFTR